MQIFVRELSTGLKHAFDVDGGMSIAHLKNKVLEKFNIPISKQQLLFGGTILEEAKMLNDYGIEVEETLILVTKTGTWGCNKCLIF